MIEITYFVHGTTLDNLEKKATGWLPGELSDKGVQQAINLSKEIKDKYFDVVICSDLKRAIESSKLNFYNRDIEIIRDMRLRECNYGELNGKDNSLVVYADHIEVPFKDGECMLDVQNRVESFIKYLKLSFNNKKVAIVAHKAPQLALEVLINKKTWEEAISTDWRLTGDWQPGWTYIIND